ncbi:hypothetical protein AXG93_4509s1060 [Marchantia polymorpha subsp. ruderalis]|uniref:Kinesin motor domain-containing protein n=1 Tax=Marchantia polymorpha subsp. ruderalis TaxID=1480154 RepID=A0A176WL73_MARPO|nr:hypothetical protein AXG93_4509s1060 [Marchantia polymorpha subsp. ruderalis]
MQVTMADSSWRDSESQQLTRFVHSSGNLGLKIWLFKADKEYRMYRKVQFTWTIHVALQDFQESVNTLRYAGKASHIQSSVISHPEKKKQVFVNMKKEAKLLQDLFQNLTGTQEDKRREEELIQLGSCLPVLSSFRVPELKCQ